jgi:hypothetical protein
MTKDWDRWRIQINNYYNLERRPLKVVQQLMAQNYGFDAS